MSMLLFMFSDFIIVFALLITSGIILWLAKRQGLFSATKAKSIWGVILLLNLGWLNLQYQGIDPIKTYLNSTTEGKDIGPIARQQQKYFGVTYNGQQGLPSLSAHINSATLPNELKWVPLLADGKLGEYDFATADKIVEQLADADIAIRGHTLIWGKWAGRTYPEALKEAVYKSTTPAITLKQHMKTHITTVMKHFHGHVQRWDVVNEPLTMDNQQLDNNLFHQILGENYIAEAFNMAREADPDALLFINEDFRDFTPATTQRFLSLIKRQLDQGAAIDGIGIQSHHIYRLKDISALKRFIRDIQQLNLLVEITELDVPIWLFSESKDPYTTQGNYYRDFAQSCYEAPHCLGVTTWGVSDNETWLDFIFPFSLRSPNQPLVFDKNMRKKPAYHGITEALLRAQEK
ncbi:endo-1,4-beta-xylanase [Thalassotalea hakodatensis]|uniref:endo-1,4-beta-xylanase n=1 Tax=Thalassotalea hakodatensis TaxID=3030492 RepID=UPI0025732CAC|nr:endo-1,4-beta-xylanase [Thalassotalea hakodatensis]